MKYIQKTLTAFLLLAISAVTFSSCNKEDNPSEETLLETYDDLRYFQDCIVNVDSTGAFRYYAYGTPLYEDEPEHLYVGVDNIAQADSIFRTWLAPDVNISESGSKLTCSFTDEEGKAQGAVSFTPGEDADVAVVTASEGTEILYFSKLTFLLNSAWPFNSAQSKWHKFDIIRNVEPWKIEDNLPSEDKRLDWVCIRESGNGVKPMFCAITQNSGMNCNSPNHGEVKKSSFCPTLSTAKNISKILKEDWDLFKAVFKEAGGDLDHDCWIDHEHDSFPWHYWDYIYYWNPDKVYGRKSWGDGSTWLLKIDWVNDDQMYDGASIR